VYRITIIAGAKVDGCNRIAGRFVRQNGIE
jgi:hypothetical protein